MLPTLGFNNAIIVMASLALSVLWVIALVSLKRRSRKFSGKQHHGAEHANKSPSRAEKALAHLIADLDKVAGVTHSAVVTTTGKLLASSTSTNEVSAQSTSELLEMYHCGKRMSNDLGQERLEQIMVRGNDGFLMIESMGDDVLLFVTVNPDAKLESVSKKVTRAAEKIQELLTQPRR